MEVGSNLSILIVDDNTSDLTVLDSILKPTYNLCFAKSGQAALKRAKENKPDLILLDVVMPDMNGFEVLTELKKSHLTSHIPVIFITGLDDADDEETGLRLGAIDYITKPFHNNIVKARVEAHLKTARRLQEKDDASIMLKSRREMRNIYYRDLIYVDVSGHWLKFHMANGEIVEVYASLKEYEGILQKDKRFARCHKSFVLNMDYVAVVEVRDIVMKNGEKLPISKKYLDMKKRYFQWING